MPEHRLHLHHLKQLLRLALRRLGGVVEDQGHYASSSRWLLCPGPLRRSPARAGCWVMERASQRGPGCNLDVERACEAAFAACPVGPTSSTGSSSFASDWYFPALRKVKATPRARAREANRLPSGLY